MIRKLVRWLTGQPASKPHIYLLEFEDGVIKVGISTKPHQRIHQIHRSSGRVVKRKYVKASPKARAVESEFIKKYQNCRIKNTEFFNMRFPAGKAFIARRL